MPLIASEKIAPKWWTPSDYEDDDDPVSFKLKPLNGSQKVELASEIIEVDGDLKISGRGLLKAIRYGLVGWKNYVDSKGKDIKFNVMSAQELPPEILSEMAIEIWTMSELGDDEKKP